MYGSFAAYVLNENITPSVKQYKPKMVIILYKSFFVSSGPSQKMIY